MDVYVPLLLNWISEVLEDTIFYKNINNNWTVTTDTQNKDNNFNRQPKLTETGKGQNASKCSSAMTVSAVTLFYILWLHACITMPINLDISYSDPCKVNHIQNAVA